MKLSEAILIGQTYAARQLHDGRFFRFNQNYSLAADDVEADVLFSAYLGKTRSKGLLHVSRLLQGDRPYDSACFAVLDTLMKQWRHLGETCCEKLEFGTGLPSPTQGLSLWTYLTILNDQHLTPRSRIAVMLRDAGY